MMALYKKIFPIWFLIAGLSLTGCKEAPILDHKKKDDYLIRVGKSVATLHDFNNTFDIARTAYPPDIEDDPTTFRELQLQVLKQMSEQLILLERAKELHIWIPESEVEAAASEIRSGYPEGEFEKTLLESAISYDFWKKALKTRMIMERVIAAELGKKIAVTSEDIAAYQEKEKDSEDQDSEDTSETVSDENEETAKRQVYRKKSEDAYQAWIKSLEEKYTIEINQAQWKKIVGS